MFTPTQNNAVEKVEYSIHVDLANDVKELGATSISTRFASILHCSFVSSRMFYHFFRFALLQISHVFVYFFNIETLETVKDTFFIWLSTYLVLSSLNEIRSKWIRCINLLFPILLLEFCYIVWVSLITWKEF